MCNKILRVHFNVNQKILDLKIWSTKSAPLTFWSVLTD